MKLKYCYLFLAVFGVSAGIVQAINNGETALFDLAALGAAAVSACMFVHHNRKGGK